MLAIGVDIGGTNVRVARVATNGAIDYRLNEPTSRDPSLLLSRLKEMIADIDGKEVAAVGIGVPGRVDAEVGRVLSGGYVDLSRVRLRDELEDHLQKPVFVDNDCNMALVGEAAFGAARGAMSCAMLTLGTGIGGALMQSGQILRGRRCAGQLGHIVVDPHGRACNCGRIGCLETASSGTSLGRIIADHNMPANTPIESLLERADRKDQAAISVLEKWANPLCLAIDSIASCFDPELVLLGGGLGRAGWQAIQRMTRHPSWGELCPVQPAALGDDAGIIGCAIASLDAESTAESISKRTTVQAR